MTRIVVALGGNALQKDGETDARGQERVARDTARQLVGLVREGHELVIVHGNGPQVGTILLKEEHGSKTPAPLDTCVAMSQGEIGYWLQMAFANELRAAGIQKPAATVITQMIVSADDPAFRDPSKPIGPFYPDESAARAAAAERQFVVKEDAGRGWRRVVASPKPLDIVEKETIIQAIAGGTIVIAAGGGGIPVVERNGEFFGVEAVIDKDFAAAKLAEIVQADILLVLTAVDAVSINFRQPDEKQLRQVRAADMQAYVAQGQFAPGSMLPKVQAALQFVTQAARRTAIITSPHEALRAFNGEAGTCVTAQ